MSRIIRIFDTTLRDGEQSPGAAMNLDEKLMVAKQLARLGVEIVVVGSPLVIEKRGAFVNRVVKANRAWNCLRLASRPLPNRSAGIQAGA